MFDRKIFFDHVRNAPFKGALNQKQVEGLSLLLDVFESEYKWPDIRHLAYVLATTYHETAATMQPIREGGSDAYLRAKPYWPYVGRGYVQLTWESNYRKMGRKLGVDIMDANMVRAMEPALAAKILFIGMRDGDFTGKCLSDYFNGKLDDPVNARRIVNGTDRAAMIAGYHKNFLAALNASRRTAPAQDPVVVVDSAIDTSVWVKRSEIAAQLRLAADMIEKGT